jgi:thioesterase domain-containing protein
MRLEEKILKNIPILKSMGAKVIDVSEQLAILKFPLHENHNHKGTVFGGSLYSSCTAACYTLIYFLQMESNLLDRDLVITQGNIQYIRPVGSDFFVEAKVDLKSWNDVVDSLKKKKPRRLNMHVEIYVTAGNILCQFAGEFAFLPGAKTDSKGMS